MSAIYTAIMKLFVKDVPYFLNFVYSRDQFLHSLGMLVLYVKWHYYTAMLLCRLLLSGFNTYGYCYYKKVNW